MNNSCTKCGAPREQAEKFCANCGTEFEKSVITTEKKPLKKLTNNVIDKDLNQKRHTIGEYVGQGLLFAATIGLAAVAPAILLCLPFEILNLIRMIRRNIRIKSLKYYVLERSCEKKEYVEPDEGSNYWQLWFGDLTQEYNVAIEVDEEFYNATEIGEEFYVVFLRKDTTPTLCYRKSEWTK